MAGKNKAGGQSVAGMLGSNLKEIGTTFASGDWKTKLSYLIMGFGPLMRGQIVKGLLFLGAQIAFIAYMIGFGGKYLSKITTLGTVATQKIGRKTVYGDNSFLILLFGILTIIIIGFFILVWRMNLRENLVEETLLKQGKKLPTNKKYLASLLDENFDKTLLALPCLGIFVFTVLPIIFMICVAFTNYDANHQSPTNLFTWVGLENFKNLFSFGTTGFGSTFITVLIWTLKKEFFNKEHVLSALLLLCALFTSYMYSRTDYRFGSHSVIEDKSELKQAVNTLLTDNDCLYLCKVDPLDKAIYSAFETPPDGYWDRIVIIGGWLTQNPIVARTMADYGIVNPYRDIVGKDNVFIIDDDIDLTIRFISEYYDPAASAELVEPLSSETGLEIYRITG